jgi:hypothetical protein
MSYEETLSVVAAGRAATVAEFRRLADRLTSSRSMPRPPCWSPGASRDGAARAGRAGAGARARWVALTAGALRYTVRPTGPRTGRPGGSDRRAPRRSRDRSARGSTGARSCARGRSGETAGGRLRRGAREVRMRVPRVRYEPSPLAAAARRIRARRPPRRRLPRPPLPPVRRRRRPIAARRTAARAVRELRLVPPTLSPGHDLYDDRDNVRLHWPRDPLRRPQSERSDVQLLQMGYLPAGDDMRWRPEERRVRLRLRLPVKAACCRSEHRAAPLRDRDRVQPPKPLQPPLSVARSRNVASSAPPARVRARAFRLGT